MPRGLSLMILGCLERSKKKANQGGSLTGADSVGQYFQWTQTLPLRKKFSGFPSFGLVATLIYVPVWLAMRLISRRGCSQTSSPAKGFTFESPRRELWKRTSLGRNG